MPKISIKADVVSRKVQDEEVVLDLGSGTYFGLNEIGTKVWEMLKEKVPLEHLSEKIAEEYEVSLKRAQKDVNTLVMTLEKKGLIEIQ